jgi:mRNA-degrading endonuclease RelE of RelBE toxin-antitoxin system
MNYNIIATKTFEKELKALCKKYPSLTNDLGALKQTLLESPTTGIHLGNDVYKIRLAIKSKGKGKSGGARVITHVQILNNIIYLVSIYDKSEKENISDDEIKELLNDIDI